MPLRPLSGFGARSPAPLPLTVFEDKPPGYLHWREVPTAILRLSSIPTLGLIRQLLDARVPPLPPPQPGGALAVLAAGGRAHLVHWALLVHASGLILPSATSICLRMRFRCGAGPGGAGGAGARGRRLAAA